ncbi:UxaA family hydrolase [Niabella insulamsoli]|uniref:UxaA family hydrolase n=1 Tax=Niabella insulamsoli TaxID=3144874 RepID=UPI0031FCCD14
MEKTKLIKIHPEDNVLIVRSGIEAGDVEQFEGQEVVYSLPIGLGHKIAARTIAAGALIIKYGVPIGSSIRKILVGEHVHLHNMKSDYILTVTRNNQFKDGK